MYDCDCYYFCGEVNWVFMDNIDFWFFVDYVDVNEVCCYVLIIFDLVNGVGVFVSVGLDDSGGVV